MGRLIKPAGIAITVLAALIVIGAAAVLGYAYLPSYLQDRLIPKMASDLGLREFSLKVRRVGISGADLAAIRIGPASQPAVLFDAVQVDYTLADLMRRTIDRVVINGLRISCEYENGRLRLDDSLAALLQPEPAAADSSKQMKTPATLPIKRLQVHNAQLELRAGGRTVCIPFEFNLIPEEAGRMDKMTVEADFRPRDQRLEAVVQTDLAAGTVRVRLTADALQLKSFADLLEPHPDLRLNGSVGIDGVVDLALNPLHITAAEGILKWQGGGVNFGSLRFKPDVPAGEQQPPWQITAGTTDGTTWRIAAAPLRVESALALRLSGLDATVQPSSGGVEMSGQIQAEPIDLGAMRMLQVPVTLMQAPRLTAKFSASLNRDRKWKFELTGTAPQSRLELQIAGTRLQSAVAGFEVAAEGDSERISAEYTAALNNLGMQTAFLKASAAAVSLKGTSEFPAGSPRGVRTEVSLALSNATGSGYALQFKGARAGFYGILRSTDAGGPQLDGGLRFSAARLAAPDAAAELNGASLNLPLHWPPPKEKGKAGNFNFASVRFQKWALANVKGAIRQTSDGLAFEGSQADTIVPGLTVNFTGNSQLIGRGAPSVALKVEAGRSESASPIDLGTLLPGGTGMALGGRLEATADFRVDASGLEGQSVVRLIDGRLQAVKENFEVRGIQLGLEMPDLPALRSAPGQQLSFASATLGDIHLKEGIIFFQIEPAPALLLEKGQFDWVEGRVDMHSTRIFLDREDYALTLFCDRLNLAKLLGQFGAAEAEGSGTVSGKIPIRYHDGEWTVADGFLFSSPGAGGQIRLQGTEALLAGIPTDSPQYMQMEIAREALKDYDYSWAKMTVNTEGDDMLLKLQLDGKPTRTLPFVFSKDMGGFARVEGQAQGSTFQGIRLDVNFRLPLNKILQYKSIIQMIRNKGAK